MVLELVLWLAAATVAYAWAGYAVAIALAARLAGRRPAARPGPAASPAVSVIVAAYNEASVIAAKIHSALAQQRYPGERIQVIVVSDGSTDGTDAAVAAVRDPRVTLLRQEPRAGKSLALNRAVAVARGDILVFTDANALFAPDALARLAAPFQDPRVGLVSGQGLYGGASGDAGASGGGYVRYEAFLKARESALGFVAGADGAIYALRRELFRDLAPAEVNDLLHPIQTALAGRLCRFEAAAVTVEPPASGAGQEFRRHVRMSAQAMMLLRRRLPALVRARRASAVWMLLSHRVLRWPTAPLLALILAATVALAGRPLYRALLVAQAAFYAVAAAGLVAERRGARLGRLALPYYFCVVALATAAGLVRSLRGGAQATWVPGGRVALPEAPRPERGRAA